MEIIFNELSHSFQIIHLDKKIVAVGHHEILITCIIAKKGLVLTYFSHNLDTRAYTELKHYRIKNNEKI